MKLERKQEKRKETKKKGRHKNKKENLKKKQHQQQKGKQTKALKIKTKLLGYLLQKKTGVGGNGVSAQAHLLVLGAADDLTRQMEFIIGDLETRTNITCVVAVTQKKKEKKKKKKKKKKGKRFLNCSYHVKATQYGGRLGSDLDRLLEGDLEVEKVGGAMAIASADSEPVW